RIVSLMPLLMLLCDRLLPKYPRTFAENNFSLYLPNCSCSQAVGILVHSADQLSPCSIQLPLNVDYEGVCDQDRCSRAFIPAAERLRSHLLTDYRRRMCRVSAGQQSIRRLSNRVQLFSYLSGLR